MPGHAAGESGYSSSSGSETPRFSKIRFNRGETVTRVLGGQAQGNPWRTMTIFFFLGRPVHIIDAWIIDAWPGEYQEPPGQIPCFLQPPCRHWNDPIFPLSGKQAARCLPKRFSPLGETSLIGTRFDHFLPSRKEIMTIAQAGF